MKYQILFIILFFNALCVAAHAQTSFLDPSFGNKGIDLTHLGLSNDNGEVTAVVVQPDQKILIGGIAAGDGRVIRYKSNGIVDSSFASNGIFTTTHTNANAIVLQTDGKIVFAGGGSPIRLNADGSLDNTFGISGVSTFTGIGCYALALQPDGKIVITGPSGTVIGIGRIMPDGTPDSSFGTYGTVTCAGNEAHGIAVQADGRIVVGAVPYDFSFMAARFLSDGAADTSFAHTGIAKVFAGDSYDYCHAMVLQADGKVVLAGSGSFGSSGSDLTLVRFNMDGSFDRSFGDTGVAHMDLKGDDDEIRAMQLMSNGKIMVGGDAVVAGELDFVVACFTGDGKIDSTFGDSGGITTDIQGYGAFGEALAIQQDGKILLCGNSAIGKFPDNFSEMTTVRYANTSLGIGNVLKKYIPRILYPNPFSNNINIDKRYADQVSSIVAIDVSGKQIPLIMINDHQIFLRSANEGNYFFKIIFNDNTVVTQQLQLK